MEKEECDGLVDRRDVVWMVVIFELAIGGRSNATSNSPAFTSTGLRDAMPSTARQYILTIHPQPPSPCSQSVFLSASIPVASLSLAIVANSLHPVPSKCPQPTTSSSSALVPWAKTSRTDAVKEVFASPSSNLNSSAENVRSGPVCRRKH